MTEQTHTSPQHMKNIAQAESILKEVFGFESFRPLQKEIITNVLEKNDTLAIMPTGGGKSLCYQIPALVFSGTTIVISPLISLMKDQVDQLTAYGISAAVLNSSLSASQYADTQSDLRNGKLDLIYLAPETLLKSSIIHLLKQININCVAIDEAHCISEWGHDFRPEYRQLADVTQHFDDAVILALTATATPQVRQDIAETLKLTDANTFVASFNRTNLFLDVETKNDPLDQTLDFLENHKEDSGIIYCFSRRQVDELTNDIKHDGFSALPYHAGLTEGQRVDHQDKFIRDEIKIIVATIAFGMGIDKPDVRFVIHYDMPKNIESYYQQIGRAGRDGLNAHCLFLFGYGDASKIRYFIQQKEEQEQKIATRQLNELIEYAETPQCRRLLLLEYFGESHTEDNCGMCDFCTGDHPESKDLTVPAQKFLSTMIRTGERFGAAHIGHVLTGSKRKRILELGHDKLSTYNIGQEFSQTEWKNLHRVLLRKDIISKDPEFGGLRVAQLGAAVLKSELPVHGMMPKAQETSSSSQRKEAPKANALDYNKDLFSILREKRMELARTSNLPPYVIFADTTLIEMAYYYPQSEATMLDIHGMGEVKFKKFGPTFMNIISTFCEENGLQERTKYETRPSGQSRSKRKKRSSSGPKRSDEVGKMFNAGSSIEDIAEHFSVKSTTVISNLTSYVKDGNALKPVLLEDYSLLSKTDQKRVRNAFQKHGTETLRPIFEELNEEIQYDDLRIIQLMMLSES